VTKKWKKTLSWAKIGHLNEEGRLKRRKSKAKLNKKKVRRKRRLKKLRTGK